MIVSFIRKTITILSWLLLASLVAAALVVYQQQLHLLTVQTGSMRPGIDPGDVVAVHSVSQDNLALGDVITFTPDGQDHTVTHRLVEIDRTNNMLVTRGDSNTGEDQPIRFDQVVGKVAYTVPFGGYAISFVQQPLGLLAVIYVPALLIIGAEIRRLAAHYKRMQPYRLPSSEPRYEPSLSAWQKLRIMSTHVLVLAVVGAGVTAPAWAQLFDTATLGSNTITVNNNPDPDPDPPTCNANNQTNISVSNSTNQTSQSGGATNSNNTNGGSASSGNASNSNDTNINVSVSNGC